MGRLSDTLLGDDLFSLPEGEAYARRTDPETSHAAARSVEPEATRLEKLVADVIKSAGILGMTCDDVVAKTGLEWKTASPRLRPLVRKGIITSRQDLKGRTIKRVGKSSRMQIVWFAT